LAESTRLNVQIDSLHPHPLNERLYPVDEVEDEELEKSIMENGILDPLVATPDGTIIHGARRWRIARKLGITHVDVEFRVFEDPERAVIEYNRYRKKTPRILWNELDFIRQKLGGQEKKLAQLKPFRDDPRFLKVEKTEDPVRADKEAAEELGVSTGQLYKIGYVYEHEDVAVAKPVVEKLDRGEISVHQAFTEVKKAIETPKMEQEPKTWKCGACQQKQDPDVQPVNLTVCPDCAMDFQAWKADKT